MIAERPRCRAVIVEQKLWPGCLYDTADGLRIRPLRCGETWRLGYAREPGSNRPVRLTDGMRKQMKKMLEEGAFCDCEDKRHAS